MEIWDAYNEKGEIIDGVELVRGEPIPDRVFHVVCDILVRHVDGTYLIMRRDPRKSHGGMWEASAGGSVLAGESALAGAIRELKEETGISAKDIVEVGRVVDARVHAIFVEFVCVTDCAKDSITLQEFETVDYRWVSRDELSAMGPDELIMHRALRFVKL